MQLRSAAITLLLITCGCSTAGRDSERVTEPDSSGSVVKRVPICGYCCGDVVTPDRTKVTIDAVDLPLSEIVADIARKTHANIIASQSLNGRATLHVTDVPCHTVLRDLLRPNNFSIDTDMQSGLVRIVPSAELAAKQLNEPISLRIYWTSDVKPSALLPLIKDGLTPHGSVGALDDPPRVVLRDVREGIARTDQLMRSLGVLNAGQGICNSNSVSSPR